ncbi:D-glycero-alpha-D-manno-heptose-1,7-bisphosphate 7-phosphatase [Streptomyces sp. NBC_00286]|uniref:D-glycero-alpha-D-manno-heptose-1,7-bisphosphate 7-phosphatase n=1 Tax=Streptomyces sp. NBC_00286 TaxID=2975701 RepID=UPI002E290A9C|nr:HAD-IIIA family hydrolase [Streptomyces sp. NBC_00286]
MTGPWLFDGPAAPPSRGEADGALPAAILFDRDGTLVADVPYNGDPARVEPMPTARDAVESVRALGIPTGVVSNQSGVARDLLTYRQVEAVRHRVDDLLGPFAVWAICPHGPDDGCACRKPAPGLILAACDRLGVPTEHTIVIGDIGADMTAAHAAGAHRVLVPTPVTRPEEIEAAESTAPDLLAAVRLVLGLGLDGTTPAHPGDGTYAACPDHAPSGAHHVGRTAGKAQ